MDGFDAGVPAMRRKKKKKRTRFPRLGRSCGACGGVAANLAIDGVLDKAIPVCRSCIRLTYPKFVSAVLELQRIERDAEILKLTRAG